MSKECQYPYCELHLHLDGSLPLPTVRRLAAMQGMKLPAESETALRPYFTVDEDCRDLNEYLEKFELPLRLLQTEEAMEFAVWELAKYLTEEHVGYAEIRFAPQLHCKKKMSQEDAVISALRGIRKAKADSSVHTECRLILCCMRGAGNHHENITTVNLAEKFLGKGVVGIDLAGAEGLYPTEDYEDIFSLAKIKQIPFTIHAGEAAGPESIRKALEFGAARIGHGIAAAQDEELLEVLKERHITVEVCPTSNLQTKAVSDLRFHPVREFLRRGIRVTVNTDNMTVSGTTPEREFRLLRDVIGLTEDEEKTLVRNAWNGRFGQ